MQHAWAGYRNFAWGKDTLKPVSQTGVDDFGGFGTTLVDSLDTLWLMGLHEEYREAVNWVREHLEFDRQEGINLFEVTIRVLGGLLGAYAQTKDCVLLRKAKNLGDNLLFAFNTETGLPWGTLGLRTSSSENPLWAMGASSVAEVATLHLEFNYLSLLTGDTAYAERVHQVAVWQAHFRGFLYAAYVHPQSGAISNRTPIGLGARMDSAYEYLGKMELFLRHGRPDWLDIPQILRELEGIESDDGNGGGEVCVSQFDLLLDPGYQETFATLYDRKLSAVELILLAHTQLPTQAASGEMCDPNPPWLRAAQDDGDWAQRHCRAIRASKSRACRSLCQLGIRPADEPVAAEAHLALWYLEELMPEQMSFSHKMDHLACFAPGMFALGASLESVQDAQTRSRHMKIARELMKTCVEFAFRMPTGLAPEIVMFEAAHTRTASFPRLREQPQPPDPSEAPQTQFFADPNSLHSLLRPETLESLFILHRTTGDEMYRDWGWRIFVSMRKYARMPGADGGYSGLKDVTQDHPDPCACASAAAQNTSAAAACECPADPYLSNRLDEMPSYLLAESLKYAWLLFSPEDVMPLGRWVFNTEAHAIPIGGSAVGAGTHCFANTADDAAAP